MTALPAIRRRAWRIMSLPWAPSTQKLYAPLFDILADALGNQPLAKVTRGDVIAILGELRNTRGLSPSGLNTYKKLLSAFFSACVDLGIVGANPVLGVKLEKPQEKAVPFLSDEDQARLLRHADSGHRPLFALLLHTGLRISEATSLCWQDVQNNALVIRRTKGKKVRTVPLSPQALQALEAFAARGSRPMRGEAPIWDGGNRGEIARALEAACQDAGLPRMTPHGLRHAFASSLAQKAVPLPVVKDLLGHSSIQTTMRYAEHAPDSAARRAIEKLTAAPAAVARSA
ncbi:MAG: tyrosine-type recombinase/integrase [Mycobacterium sp.]